MQKTEKTKEILLAENGYEVFRVVREGMNKRPIQLYDLIILDLGMPIMDGYQAANKIK